MTCIVAWIEDGDVWVGGDSAGVSGWAMHLRADAKVFTNHEYVMGFTTSFRMGQILRYSLEPPSPPGNRGLSKFMATTFIDAVRKSLSKGGYAKKELEVESGGEFIVGCVGRLFIVHSDYQVAEPIDNFAAVGCGQDIARGSLYATRKQKFKPRERLLAALTAAERYSAGVRRPFIIRHTQEK